MMVLISAAAGHQVFERMETTSSLCARTSCWCGCGGIIYYCHERRRRGSVSRLIACAKMAKTANGVFGQIRKRVSIHPSSSAPSLSIVECVFAFSSKHPEDVVCSVSNERFFFFENATRFLGHGQGASQSGCALTIRRFTDG
jgi:hypothetical protein